ncbi:hypothetical protein [Neobacillus cucumis]|uniref:Uncharacterized protein n=1 Tax=Neobacillus cucumis TaxID=1740721 RepID=A0A2N5HJV1_9BACI|nr:hypothetical protein [Neobacillus cucumis]PLS05768.1 hypothetical protein CVD27_08650 [Neobacillus cucumis]
MFSRIALIALFLFFLSGTNGFAYTHSEKYTPKFDFVQTESIHNNSTLTLVTVSNKNSNIQATDTKHTNNETENAVLLMNKNQSTDPSFKEYVVPAAVCLFLFIGLSFYWLVFRRKKL